MQEPHDTLHATAIAIDGKAILLRGPSGAGKSDLALTLLDRGHKLIADDYIHLKQSDYGPLAAPPKKIHGMIEVRGLGLVHLKPTQLAKQSPIALIVDLVPRGDVPRMPEDETVSILGLDIPRLRLHAFDSTTPIKIELALTATIINDREI